jgi:hypothetical protein
VYSAEMSILICSRSRLARASRLLILCFVQYGTNDSLATAGAPESKIPQLPFQLCVVDSADSPIPGVTVRTLGLRMKVGRGSRFNWMPEQHGPPSEALTDSFGIARLAYPKWTVDEQVTGVVDCSFDHPAYVSTRAEVRVDDREAQVGLRRGVRLAVTAMRGESGDRIKQNLYGLLCGHRLETEWKTFSNGTLMSRPVAFERDRLRVFHLPDNGPPLWSDLLKPENGSSGSRVMLRNVPLTPGMRLTGHLTDDVPRPVSNGYVSIVATQHTGMRDAERSLQWSDWGPIDADGSFEFPSLPRDGFVQLFAFCDGWTSASPKPEDLEKVGLAEFRADLQREHWHPQMFRLRKGERSCDVPMNPTAECRIHLVTEDDRGLAAAIVSAHPRQIWISGGAQSAGSGFSIARFMKLPVVQQTLIRKNPHDPQWNDSGVRISSQHKYQQMTDEDGWALIPDLPVPRSGELCSHLFSAVKHGPLGTLKANPVASSVVSGQSAQLTLRVSGQ